jgi:ABC-type bacteriocin/lantibiotic exporter with double-glycine peptidase domain
MSIFILIFALLGWVFAFVFFILLMVASLAFGAAQELLKEQNDIKVNGNTKTETKLWSLAKEKEIPFGD